MDSERMAYMLYANGVNCCGINRLRFSSLRVAAGIALYQGASWGAVRYNGSVPHLRGVSSQVVLLYG